MPLDVPTMARKALMSPAHFSRQFRAAYGETPYSYLMTRRIERAMALLRGGMSVTDACMAVGCTSLGSFSSRFTEIVGETAERLPDPRAQRGGGHARVRGEDPDKAHPAKHGSRCSRSKDGVQASRIREATRTPAE